MNEKFVTRVCKDYLLDRQFVGENKETVMTEMVTDIREHIKDLYENDIEFYNSLWDQKPWHQQEVLNKYLDLTFCEDNRFKFFQQESEEAQKSLLLLSEDFDNIEDDGILSKAGKWARDSWVQSGSHTVVEGTAEFFSGFVKAAGALILMPFKLVTSIVTGRISFTIFAASITFLLTTSHGKRLGRNIGYVIGSFGKNMENMGKHIVNQGRYFKFRYAIIQKNAAQCYKEADISKEELGFIDHFIIGKLKFPIVTEAMIKKSSVLQECFITYTVKSIALYMQSYFICLKRTGAFQEYERISPDELMKVVAGVQLSSACQDYHAEIRESVDNFYSLLDFAYADNTSKKTKAVLKLRDEVIQARNQVSRAKNLNKFK